MKLSILMPAYNEESTIRKIVDLIDKVDLSSLGVERELVIVDDGSKDSTPEVIKELQKRYGYVKFIQHEKNLGKGAAVKTAIKHATGDIFIVQDADLEYDPQDYLKCISPIIEGRAKVVYGSRRLDKNNLRYAGPSFYIGGIGVTFVFNVLFSTRLTDEPTCYKTFKSDVIKNMKINGDRFEWEPEITAKVIKQGIRIYEVPINYYPRSIDEGKKIKWRDGFIALWAMMKYRFVD